VVGGEGEGREGGEVGRDIEVRVERKEKVKCWEWGARRKVGGGIKIRGGEDVGSMSEREEGGSEEGERG